MSFLRVHSLVLSLICLSSPSLCLLFLNHSQAQIPQFYSGTVRRTSQTFKLSVCVCDICVFLPSFKVQMCTHNLETPKAYLLHVIMDRIIFRIRAQQINVCLLVFYVCWIVVLQRLQRWELLHFVVVVSALSFLMGIHAVLPLVKHQQLIRNTNKTVWVCLQTHTHALRSLHCHRKIDLLLWIAVIVNYEFLSKYWATAKDS